MGRFGGQKTEGREVEQRKKEGSEEQGVEVSRLWGGWKGESSRGKGNCRSWGESGRRG